MNPNTQNEFEGKLHEVKGKVKEKVGRLIDDPDLEDEGTGEQIAGKVQTKIGQVGKVLEKIIYRSMNRYGAAGSK
jgi:uncharacterized protein YjbJ (UPF0337 family)